MPNNIGAFGENFPYSNFHNMNTDWIVKIAKDFLDQYTQIEQIISEGIENINGATEEGLTNLQEKATELENLLQEWYDTHSEDIANELTDAIAEFSTTAQQIAEQTIASIPSEYTDVYNRVVRLERLIKQDIIGYNVKIDLNSSTDIATITGGRVSSHGHLYRITANNTIQITRDNTTRWLITTLDTTTDYCTFSIVAQGYTFLDNEEFIGYIYNDIFALGAGFHYFIDGIFQHGDWDTWTDFSQFLVRGLQGPERMIVFDLKNKTIKIPSDIVGLSGSVSFTTSAQTLSFAEFTQRYLSLIYDRKTEEFSIVATTFDRNRYLGIAMIDKNVNFVYCRVPYTVITSDERYYNVLPEIVIYGDSIVAGAGGDLGFENIISGKTGIRLLNRGIGSTGYLTRVEANTQHLAGNDTPTKGTQQIITYADNSVEERITNDIANITQNVVAIMAGTNDYPTYNVNSIIASMGNCCDIILNSGKIPVIISPIRRENRDLSSLVNAMEEYCNTNGIIFINVYNCGINPSNTANKNKYIPDGIHPSDNGYYILASKIANHLKDICITDKMC